MKNLSKFSQSLCVTLCAFSSVSGYADAPLGFEETIPDAMEETTSIVHEPTCALSSEPLLEVAPVASQPGPLLWLKKQNLPKHPKRNSFPFLLLPVKSKAEKCACAFSPMWTAALSKR